MNRHLGPTKCYWVKVIYFLLVIISRVFFPYEHFNYGLLLNMFSRIDLTKVTETEVFSESEASALLYAPHFSFLQF